MTRTRTTAAEALNIAEFAYDLTAGQLVVPQSLLESGWRLDLSLDKKGFIDDPDTGLKAALLTNSDGRIAVSFAGTEGIQDGFADIGLGWSQWQAGREQILDHLRDVGSAISEIHFTGHSLGGALAQYAAYEFWLENGGSLRDDVAVGVTTFNALSGTSALTQNLASTRNQNVQFDPQLLAPLAENIRHFVVDGDFVSRLGGGHVGGQTLVVENFSSVEGWPPRRHPPGRCALARRRTASGSGVGIGPPRTASSACSPRRRPPSLSPARSVQRRRSGLSPASVAVAALHPPRRWGAARVAALRCRGRRAPDPGNRPGSPIRAHAPPDRRQGRSCVAFGRGTAVAVGSGGRPASRRHAAAGRRGSARLAERQRDCLITARRNDPSILKRSTAIAAMHAARATAAFQRLLTSVPSTRYRRTISRGAH